MRSMAQVNVAAEVEKGGAIKRQTAVWESLLECRIQVGTRKEGSVPCSKA